MERQDLRCSAPGPHDTQTAVVAAQAVYLVSPSAPGGGARPYFIFITRFRAYAETTSETTGVPRPLREAAASRGDLPSGELHA